MNAKKGAITCILLLVLVACPLLLAPSDGIHQGIDDAYAESHPYTKITPSAVILFQENFNGYSAGSYPTGWYTHDDRPAGTIFDVNNTVIDSGNCLRIVDNQTTDAGWGRVPFSKAIESGIVEFKVQVKGALTGSATMQHYVYLQDSANTTGISVNMQQNLTGNYWTIGFGATMNETHLNEDTTYSVKVVFNKVSLIMDFLVFDLYVNNQIFLNDQFALFRTIDRLYVGSTGATNTSTWFFDTFVVTDTIAGNIIPSINSPPDMTMPPGASGQSIAWTITDPDTVNPSYYILQNGSLAGIGSWTPGVPIQFALPALEERRTYNFTIIVTDGLNATAIDTVLVRTTANTPPVISGRLSVSFEYGSDGENLTWKITDPSVDTDSICGLRQNGTLLGTTGWVNGETFQYNTTGMAIGSYNFTFTADDGMANSTSYTTILNIVGDLPPRISNPGDIIYQADTTGNTITWTISDFNMTAGWYAVYKDDVLQSNNTWAGPTATVSINVDGLAKGGYTYKIVASDGRSTSSDTVAVTVTNPLLDALIIVLVVAGIAIAIIAAIAIKRKKNAGGGKVKRKVPQQAAVKPAKSLAQQPPQAAPAGGRVVTCPSCGTPFTLAPDYLKQYAGQNFKCTKCQTDIAI